jgi:hypothetical protein
MLHQTLPENVLHDSHQKCRQNAANRCFLAEIMVSLCRFRLQTGIATIGMRGNRDVRAFVPCHFTAVCGTVICVTVSCSSHTAIEHTVCSSHMADIVAPWAALNAQSQPVHTYMSLQCLCSPPVCTHHAAHIHNSTSCTSSKASHAAC